MKDTFFFINQARPANFQNEHAMLKRNNSNSSTRRIRRSTSNDVSSKMDLDAHQVEYLIRWLCVESNDEVLAKTYHQMYHRLADQHKARAGNNSTNSWTEEELCDIITALQTLLSTVQEPPSALVAEVHSTIGIIYQRLNHDARATQSFMQALWVQTSSDDVSPVTVGLTKTRLALAYGHTGEHEKAISLLQKALQDFKEGGLTEDHVLVSRATEALYLFNLSSTQRIRKSSSRRISPGAA